MGKISIQDLVSTLMERRQIGKKQALKFVNGMFDVIQKALDEEKIVKVKGLGTFRIIAVEDRESVNVNTGDRVLIEGHGKITFTPDTLMKELVNKPFSQFETVVLNEGVDFDDSRAEEGAAQEPAAADEVKVLESPVTALAAKEPVSVEPAPVKSVVDPERVEHASEPSSADPITEPVPVESSAEPISAEPTQMVESPVEIATKEQSEEEAEDNSVVEGYDGQESKRNSMRWPLIAIAACVIGFAIGFFVGKNNPAEPWAPQQTAAESTTSEEPELPLPAKPARDSLATAMAIQPDSMPKPARQDNPIKAVVAPTKAEEAPAKKAETAAAAQPANSDEYEKLDARVRTGAYRIVGLDRMERVRPNDNLARICKRTLGPGMECYIEVFNGIRGDAALKDKKEIKIPKLQWKRKRTQKQAEKTS